MAKLGSDKRPAVARARTLKRSQKITDLCNEHGWKVIVEIESGKPEDLSDVERLLNPQKPLVTTSNVGVTIRVLAAAV